MLSILLLGMLIVKTIWYKPWARYTYQTSVSTPQEFPIHLFGIWFSTKDNNYVGSFYQERELINSFSSDWGKSRLSYNKRSEFLPETLFLEYVDFRTKNYYVDTIVLPKEKLKKSFQQINQGKTRKGKKEIHVGIANDGNIVFWVVQHQKAIEFYSTTLQAKPFPEKIHAYGKPKIIKDKEEYIRQQFENIPDRKKTEILNKDVSEAEFKDSIPTYFEVIRK